jgi:drug/metabolite transporter (DMT)-like permease
VARQSILAPVIYIQIFLAALSGIIFFNTWPTIWALVGGLIIIGAGIYIWHRESRTKHRPATHAKITPK